MSLLFKHRPKQALATPEPLFEDPFRLLRDLGRWDPFTEPLLRSRMDTFFPAFELKESSTAINLKADLPGFKEEDLHVSVAGNRLTIGGKREAEHQKDDEVSHIYERSFGSFSRTFNLPEDVDANQVDAQLKDGVLSVRIPKSPEIHPRRIEVKTS